MKIKQSLKRQTARRLTIAGASVLFSAVLAACGGGDGTSIGSTMDKSTMMAAKAANSLDSIAIPLQPNQSVTNLSSVGGDGSGELWYSVTVPAGTNSIRIATSGGSGNAVISTRVTTDLEVNRPGDLTCSGSLNCQIVFAPLTAAKTYYINVGTRSSYSDKTLTTYVTSGIIPIVSGTTVREIPVSATDDPLMFSIDVPPGSTNFSLALANGSGKSPTFEMMRGISDPMYAFTMGDGTSWNDSNPIPATYYFYLRPAFGSTDSIWTLDATVK
ncbi:pre-peptidase C-terminal domain-containing protein [Paraburkholderia dinghuensis]|uniref:Peptidase C-terminal archaeal/bacterial domain-containing protein n=1 Tax=Paraburkholderia dinghuensis TaxID=2305225 RepID=A0A3N6MA65_9BURK|nr:pre-peptidase C-terminal domain-containing protein [Paraburkholderia dinghuensis]RQH00684.1 hypothetical protein D1Y85_24630 [Paraburkholderia dinghuensis]